MPFYENGSELQVWWTDGSTTLASIAQVTFILKIKLNG